MFAFNLEDSELLGQTSASLLLCPMALFSTELDDYVFAGTFLGCSFLNDCS